MKIVLTQDEREAIAKLVKAGVKADIVLDNGDIVSFWPIADKFCVKIDYTSGVQCNQCGPWKEGLEYLGLNDYLMEGAYYEE